MGRRSAPMVPRKVAVNGGQTRWEVRIAEPLRKQEGGLRRYFPTQAEAKGFCNRLESSLRNYADKSRGLSDRQKIEAQDAFAKLQAVPGATLMAAVDHYLAHLAQSSRSVTLEQLGDRLVAERRAVGGKGAGERTLDEIEERWGRFARDFPNRMASTITPEEVNEWIIALPVALATKRGYRRVLHLVFSYAAARVRRLVSSNPVAEVDLPSSTRQRVALLTPEETTALLGAAVPEMRPYFAICAFAGARPDQAKKTSWSQIHLDRMEIEIPAGSDKTDRERIVPIQPNLAAWLQQVPESARTGRIFYSRAWAERARADAKIGEWVQDCLRHGYCSYRLKITGSFGKVADEAGNSEKVIRERYYRSVSETVAEEYFALMPPPLPDGYVFKAQLKRWNMAPALAARILPLEVA